MVGPAIRKICELHGISNLVLGYLLRLKSKGRKLVYVLFDNSTHEFYACDRAGVKSDGRAYKTFRQAVLAIKAVILRTKKPSPESCVKNTFLFDGRLFISFTEQGARARRGNFRASPSAESARMHRRQVTRAGRFHSTFNRCWFPTRSSTPLLLLRPTSPSPPPRCGSAHPRELPRAPVPLPRPRRSPRRSRLFAPAAASLAARSPCAVRAAPVGIERWGAICMRTIFSARRARAVGSARARRGLAVGLARARRARRGQRARRARRARLGRAERRARAGLTGSGSRTG